MISRKPSRWLFSRTRKRPAGLLPERLGCDQLERRVVLDGDSLAPPAEALIVDSPFTMPTPTAMAQFGDFTYEIVGASVTITKYSGNTPLFSTYPLRSPDCR